MGGTYFMEWEGECGGQLEGEFLQIEEFQKVVFTWPTPHPESEGQFLATQVTLELFEEDGATLMTLLHEGFESYADLESHTGGWQQALKGFLDSLRDIVATHAVEQNSLDLNARYRKTINAPVEDVFKAVADGSKLAQYFPVNREDNFEVGKEVIWEFDNYPPFTLNVHERIENQIIKFQWGTMHVCFTFRGKEHGKTEVYLEFTSSENDQKGFENFTDECEGWSDFLFRLKLFIEKGFKIEDYA